MDIHKTGAHIGALRVYPLGIFRNIQFRFPAHGMDSFPFDQKYAIPQNTVFQYQISIVDRKHDRHILYASFSSSSSALPPAMIRSATPGRNLEERAS